MNAIRGIAASPGIAIGTAVIVAESLSQVSFRQVAPEEVAEERSRLEAALAESAAELTELRDASAATMGREAAAIFDFHLGLLRDRSLVGAIIADIERGVPAQRRSVLVAVEEDRRRGIARALAEARSGDVVVVAGKGHESTQTIADREIPFRDVDVVRELAGAAA